MDNNLMVRNLSDHECVLKIHREFQNAIQFNDKNFAAATEAWRFYWGKDAALGLGQWPSNIASEMIREGRFLATYNFCQPICDSIAGGLMKAPFNADFSPVDGPLLDVTSSLRDQFIIDKEMTDWNAALRQAAIAGCVYESAVELYINRDYLKSGNIGLRYRLPMTVTFDPFVKTGRHKDMKKCWVTHWMTPVQMMQQWKEKSDVIASAVVERAKNRGEDVAPIIQALAEMQARMGDEYGQNYGPTPYLPNDTTWGTQYRVIAEYRVSEEKNQYEYAMTSGEPVVIPGDIGDAPEKIEWLNKNAPDWSPEGVGVDEITENIQTVTYICPDLVSYDFLECGRTEIQCGALSFVPFAVNNMNGERTGIVGAVIDAQKNINNLESMLTHKLQVEGGGGAQFVDPDGFKDDKEAKRYKRFRNNPRESFELKSGYLRKNPNGPAVPVQKSQFPAEVTEHLRQMIETIIPRISKVSPAWQGRSEGTNESGYLFKLKRIQSEIEQYTLYESWRQFHNELGECYLYAAANHYGDGVPRQVYNPKTKGTFTINERVWDGGREVIKNNFSLLKYNRHRVIITESEDAPTRKYETMTVASEAMKSLPPTMMLHQVKLGTMLARSIDQFTVDDTEELKALAEIEMQFAIQKMRTDIATLKLNELSAIQQIKALQAAEIAQQQQMMTPQIGAPAQAPAPAGPEQSSLPLMAGKEPAPTVPMQ